MFVVGDSIKVKNGIITIKVTQQEIEDAAKAVTRTNENLRRYGAIKNDRK